VRKRLNYANVTATLALFFALSGGAIAAKRYLISSTKQISPKVMKALKGNRGPAGSGGSSGAAGATGLTGKEGPQGREGAQGKEGAPGREGAPGKEGPAGKDGAVAGFSATHGEPVDFTSGSEGTPTTIVSKALPAGNFIVNGKVEVLLSDSKTEGSAAMGCKLTDTPSSGGGSAVSDSAPWASLMNYSTVSASVAQNTLPLTLAVSSELHASTATLGCYVLKVTTAGGEFHATASKASITAVQTSQNG
jgi:Collagen triple helix repeat (20 copies)